MDNARPVSHVMRWIDYTHEPDAALKIIRTQFNAIALTLNALPVNPETSLSLQRLLDARSLHADHSRRNKSLRAS